MRLAYFLVFFVLSTLCYALKPSAYCEKTVKRPQKVFRNGIEKTDFKNEVIKTCCEGYANVHGECIPLCEVLCINAECTAPNYCTCKTGYKKLDEHRCSPVCEDCENGFCSSPDICTCHVGFEKNTTTGRCEPKCDNPCANGYCRERNFCLCILHSTLHYKIPMVNLNMCLRNNTAQRQTISTTSEEETSIGLYSTSTVDEAFYFTSTVETVQPTFANHQDAKKYEHSMEIIHQTEEENMNPGIHDSSDKVEYASTLIDSSLGPTSEKTTETSDQHNHLGATVETETKDLSTNKSELSNSWKTTMVWISLTVAVLAIVAIILMIAFTCKYFVENEYNVEKIEKRRGMATHSTLV